MYVPAKFKPDDRASLLELMREYPFATLITHRDGRLEINAYPILCELRGDEVFLLGHLARANPQWKDFGDGAEATAVFHGPNAYITPSWYPDPMNVPTWNYAQVQASGPVTPIENPAGIEAILQRTVTELEAREPKPWSYALPEDFRAGLIRAIVGFEIRVTRLEGKLKLSQNRTSEDRAGVLRGLATRQDEMSRKTLELMLKLANGEVSESTRT